MAEHHHHHHHHHEQHQFSDKALTPSQVLTVVTILPVGLILLLLAGVTLTGTLFGLAVTAPLFLIFSPILVPAALVITLAVAGIVTSGAFGITALSAFTWMANYLRTIRGGFAEAPERLVDEAKWRGREAAGYLGQKTREVGQTVQSKAHEESRTQEGEKAGEEGEKATK